MRRYKSRSMLGSVRALEAINGFIAIIGFFLVGGAMGACDNGVMELGRAVMWIIIGGTIGISGTLAGIWFSKFDDEDEKEKTKDDLYM